MEGESLGRRPELEGVSSVLLLAPSASDDDDDACTELLTREDPLTTNVLSVTTSESPTERIALWQREVGTLPGRIVVADAGSVRQGTSDAERRTPASVTVDTLPADAEPLDIGMAVARWIGHWESTAEPTALCLHSLTALFDAFDRADVVSLITGINRLCGTLGVTGHHHIDPMTVDESLLSILRPLYDAVIEHQPEGGWIVTCADTDADPPSFRRSTPPPGGTAMFDPDGPETVPVPYSFDRMLDLISITRRRTLLYHLKDTAGEPIPMDDLVDAVFGRERSIPVREAPDSKDVVRTSLVHVHLPRLAEAGIVAYDTDGETVEYRDNPALESFLRYLETLELG